VKEVGFKPGVKERGVIDVQSGEYATINTTDDFLLA